MLVNCGRVPAIDLTEFRCKVGHQFGIPDRDRQFAGKEPSPGQAGEVHHLLGDVLQIIVRRLLVNLYLDWLWRTVLPVGSVLVALQLY